MIYRGVIVLSSRRKRHCILAATSRDLGTLLYGLSLKRAHSALNESMRLNRLFIHHDSQTLENYLTSVICMHDLKIWQDHAIAEIRYFCNFVSLPVQNVSVNLCFKESNQNLYMSNQFSF